MRTFLLILIALILVLFLSLFKLDYVSSIFPGWNSHINDSRFYSIILLLNIIIPIFLYFGIRKFVSLYIFLFYFFIVNVIFITGELLVYDGITPGSTNQNFQNYMAIQRFLVYGTFSIHLIFYLFFYLKFKERKNKGNSFDTLKKI